jgi:peptidoglycan/LPS O-acetylase OafA/YrhL
LQAERIASLDLLRGAAAFTVAITHFLAHYDVLPAASETASVIGVEVFFVLSGFVLGPQIITCLTGARSRDFGIFLLRRWMRTVPPYIVALCFISALYGEIGTKQFFKYAFYVQNLTAFPTDDYFSVAWSLSVEEWFYVTFPAVLLAASTLVRDRSRKLCLAAVCGYILAISLYRIMDGNLQNWGEDVRRVVIFRVDSIAYGFLLFLIYRSKSRISKLPLYRLALLALVVATTVGSIVLTIDAASGTSISKQLFPFVMAVFGALLIAGALELGPFFAMLPAVSQVSYFLGKISYSVYLFHIIGILIISGKAIGYPIIGQFGLYLVSLLLFSTAFYKYFEAPILGARPAYGGRRSIQPANSGDAVSPEVSSG